MDGDMRKVNAISNLKLKEAPSKTNGARVRKTGRSSSSTPNGSMLNSRGSSASPDDVKPESGGGAPILAHEAAPKTSRKASQKGTCSPPLRFAHLADVTDESCKTFQVINDCLYGSKHMGATEHDVWDCDCAQEWHDDQNHACGEDSDCINRHTKMECVDGDCNCGPGCQNQRFQRKQYANVSVIKTEKKGFGLRADSDLQPNDFVFEYIGEVINEATFRNRMVRYDKEGIKHFYFMSLNKSEFVDATKKGNLGRFCNHSCDPNCYVDKWVVGDKLRMGIFAGRSIMAGEELVFNYNVDRYGADPQPCYCGEKNCTGYIGGKTQTERATKLSLTTIEALGIDDGDSWDTTVAKKPTRKKRPNENDEDYINSVQPVGLAQQGVTKVMATLMQCKEKWIAVKLLSRIQESEDEHVRDRVVRMHGYQILKSTLNTFKDDANVVLQILDILLKLPRLTKNKIADSKIEAAVQPLLSSEHGLVASEAKKLLDEWSKLETAYRIPRKKIDPAAPVSTNSMFEEERRNAGREESKPGPFANVVVPTGPKSNFPQRNIAFFGNHRPRKLPTNLPAGWFVTTDKTGKYYFYNKSGVTTWHRPTIACVEGPKASAKVKQDIKTLQDIIDSITKEPTPRHSATQTPQQTGTPVAEPRKEKWRSLPPDKQMKIYENTLSPVIKHVMAKFHNKLPREELKKFAKEISKKLVASDYKHARVDDPTSITEKQKQKVKKHVLDFFERAVLKYKEHEQRATGRPEKHVEANSVIDSKSAVVVSPLDASPIATKVDDVVMSDCEDAEDIASDHSERKRKRQAAFESPAGETSSDAPLLKRLKEEDIEAPSPPPPPPPPPEGIMAEEALTPPLTEEDRFMREQEEALMRENEEAQRLEDEAALNQGKKQKNCAVKAYETGVNGAVSGTETTDGGSMQKPTDAQQQEVFGQ